MSAMTSANGCRSQGRSQRARPAIPRRPVAASASRGRRRPAPARAPTISRYSSAGMLSMKARRSSKLASSRSGRSGSKAHDRFLGVVEEPAGEAVQQIEIGANRIPAAGVARRPARDRDRCPGPRGRAGRAPRPYRAAARPRFRCAGRAVRRPAHPCRADSLRVASGASSHHHDIALTGFRQTHRRQVPLVRIMRAVEGAIGAAESRAPVEA